jgi:tetratricopeptide (TPR) repeat protein
MLRILSMLLLPVFAVSASARAPAAQDPAQKRDLNLTKLEDIQRSGSVPRGYALVIGIAKYKNLEPSMQLQFSESDAEAMYSVLISQEGGAFPAENVHLLKGKQATLANIRNELETWLPSVAQPSDRVLVYFAGHGFVENSRGYVAPWDLDLSNLESTAYPMAALGDVLANRVNARWKVLLTDACHSGRINLETTNEAVDAEVRRLPGNFLTLTATRGAESSYEDPNLLTGFGLFTYFLIQAWKGYADTDPCDGKITADELVEYVTSNVKNWARDHSLSQTPRERGDYDGNMTLGVSRACLNASSPAPSMLGTAVVETNMDDVDVYVDGKLVGKAQRSHPLVMPGLSSGPHTFEGVKPGYDPDRKEIMIAPGQEATVSIRIRYPRQIKKSAAVFNADGEKLLFTTRSTVNPLNITPIARSQGDKDLRKARDLFTRALKEDATYSQAAFNLGQVNQYLSESEASMNAYRNAIQIDPSYVDARLQYAALLIENGDPDEAIRQLNEVTGLEPSNSEAYSKLARAYWDKGVWGRTIEMADKAIALNRSNEQAHLWKADALRQMAAEEKQGERQKETFERAREYYKEFLSLTNYSTPALDWALFHFVGFHLGSRRHADVQSSYDSLRSSAFLGVCLCDQQLGNPQRAKDNCERALKYDPHDAIALFTLGNVYRDLFNAAYNESKVSGLGKEMNQNRMCNYIIGARNNYQKMVSVNSDIAEARHARAYLEDINSRILPALQSYGCR